MAGQPTPPIKHPLRNQGELVACLKGKAMESISPDHQGRYFEQGTLLGESSQLITMRTISPPPKDTFVPLPYMTELHGLDPGTSVRPLDWQHFWTRGHASAKETATGHHRQRGRPTRNTAKQSLLRGNWKLQMCGNWWFEMFFFGGGAPPFGCDLFE